MVRVILSACFLAAFLNLAFAQDAWFSRGHGRPPTQSEVNVCHGYTCRIVTPVRFGDAEIARIAGTLSGVSDAVAERHAVSQAVQEFERIVGARIGTVRDLPAMQFGRGADDQMDCIDEATNTTGLLMLLAKRGYLKHHTVGPPSARGYFIDGRYPHATAVLTDTKSGEKWAVDSWPRANGEPPLIMPLAQWKRERRHIPDAYARIQE